MAIIGLIGALIGGGASLYGSYLAWDLQQETLNQQEIMELGNIARALYIDISITEDRLNKTLILLSQLNGSQLDDQNAIFWSDVSFYPKDGLYYTFKKDISRFDNITSQNLYIFYNTIIELEYRREFREMANEKISRDESLSSHEINLAHIYTTESVSKVPEFIKYAKQLKQNLAQKYPIDA